MNKWLLGLLTITGLLIGIAIGLLIAWGLAPVQFVDTAPVSLRTDFKDDYRFMIASAYAATGDLQRANARLAVLGDPDPVRALSEQAQRMLSQNTPLQSIQVLSNLSEALQTRAGQATLAGTDGAPTAENAGGNNTPVATAQITLNPPASTQDAAQVTSTPASLDTSGAENTPLPGPTLSPLAPSPKASATATPGKPFVLSQQTTVCDPDHPGLLQVYLSDARGKPIAGIELIITWFNGEEHFFTGLKPEINPGYADYTLDKSAEYDLTFPFSGVQVTGLRAPACNDSSGAVYPGGIRLDFKQP